jgi:hypothetical protein
MAAMSLNFELSKQTSSLITAYLPSHSKFARLLERKRCQCMLYCEIFKDFLTLNMAAMTLTFEISKNKSS